MILNQATRPKVLFDPTNAEHRQHYWTFLQQRSWGHCPVVFTVESKTLDTAATMQRQLAEYYLNNEFKND